MVEAMSLKSIEGVLRTEPNAVTIIARDVAAEMAAGGGCETLRYRLSWNLPPVAFFSSRQMAQQPAVRSLSTAIRDVAVKLAAANRENYEPLSARDQS